MNNSQTLLKLQINRSTISKSRIEIDQLNSLLNDHTQETEYSQQIDGLGKNVDSLETKFSQIDTEKSNLQQKNRLNDAKLYSGNVVNPKELLEIEKDIANNKKRIEVLEAEEVTILLQLENGNIAFSNKETEFRDFGTQQVSKSAEINYSINTLTNKINELETQAADLTKTLSPELLHQFNELMLSKKGMAVAVIRENCCSVCGSDISLNIRLAARSNETITTCPSCRRILITE